ncbi:MAG TPA: YciI family protein [Trebonia sp.]|nr:YciI family protein [Trebonia sp.]
MKYVLLILDTPAEPAPGTPELNAWFAEISAWYEKWVPAGKLASGHQLQGPVAARTVRAAGVTDRPFIESEEAIGGYSVLDADSIEEAVEVAKTWPGLAQGWVAVEVRPVIEMG